MDRNQADALVARLGGALGISELALDEDGSCTLAIDDGAVIVVLGYNSGARSLDLMTCLDQVEATDANVSRALRANFTWRETGGATFAIDPGSGALVLQRRLDDEDSNDDALKAALEGLVAMAEAWTERFLKQQAGGTSADSTPPLGSMRP